jgi:type VI secretion system secreted protein VgrG
MSDPTTTFSFTFEIDGLSAVIRVARFEGEEGISQLFQFQVLFTSPEADIAFADVIGKKALLTIHGAGTEARYVQGIISRFAHGESGKKQVAYRATLVPTLWRLHHRRDSRIFQELAVPDIIEKVLQGAGFSSSDYTLSLEASHPKREYCVQYRESDLAFISRLMEEEGIHYFFQHTQGGHVLVMGDGSSVHDDIADPAAVVYRPSLGALTAEEHVTRFVYAEEMRPGKVTLTDFNFKKPSLSLLESSAAALDPDLELYDFPGEYDVPDAGGALAKIRLEEAQTARKVGDGESACPRFTPGYLFSLSEHPRDADNRGYLITRVRHQGATPQMGEVGGNEQLSYANEFLVVPDDVPYRPTRRTARPTVKGVQTAIVTGPAGEEVYVDEHGRVKVHFHWDRLGKSDDTSSCWIRVSQVWAGAGWGAMWIPRIGHEVVVDFLEGDPDRPLIVGRVYHGANVPPYPLPAEKTKSTIKSNSSKGGGGNNELRFEDKKGQEEIWLHGQKDWNIKIEHDKNQLVGHDETKKVGHDETYEIGNDQTLTVDHNRDKTVKNDQSETIGGNKTIAVTKSHTETIGGDESLDVSGGRSVSVSKDHTESVSGNQTVAVGGDQSISISKGKSESIGQSSAESVAKSKSVTVDEGYTLTVTKDGAVKFGKNLKQEVGEKHTMIVGKELGIQVGDATVTITKDGNITVQGKNITLKGSGPIQVQGSKLQLKSDGDVSVEASGNVKVKGSNVGVN